MADPNTPSDPALQAVADVPPDSAPQPDSRAKGTQTFEPDAFLAGKIADPKIVEPSRSAPPQVVKRGGIGFLSALLMSTVAAGAGAYLALLAGSRPDLVQKAGIGGFVPAPPPTPSLGTSDTNIQPLIARIAAVEGELLALRTRVDGGTPTTTTTPTVPPAVAGGAVPTPPTGAAPGAPPAAAPADTSALKAELQGMGGRLTAIETRLAALDPTGTGGAVIAGLQAEIAGLKVIVGTLQQQAASAPSPAATFAVLSLAEAAGRSGPFMIEFETVRTAMPGVPEVAALEPFARTGVATRQLLQERFITLQASEAAQAAAIAASQKETGFVAWIRGLFSDMIKIEAPPATTGTSANVVLASAKVKLDQGDLAGCVSDMATIPTPSTNVTEWMNSARKRLDLESRISAVRGALGRGATVTAGASTTPAPAPANSNVQPVPAQSLPLPPPPVPVPAPKSQGTNP